MDTYCWEMLTEIGWLTLTQSDDSLTSLAFGQKLAGEAPLIRTPLLQEAEAQLQAYLNGRLQRFSLPLSPVGTPFQRSCWNALLQIPYGCTWSYSQQAGYIGKPAAVRAVGQANHHNPLPIFIPCHRVIGKNGTLTGYGGGTAVKQQLLLLESQAVCSGQNTARMYPHRIAMKE